jgi:drug/metabolite transporter (DMT)-like permease
MFMACAFWGLMAPLGKDAMTHGIDGLHMVTFRVVGGCLLFWLTSLFVPKEHVPKKDVLLFAAAAVFGLVLNQCCLYFIQAWPGVYCCWLKQLLLLAVIHWITCKALVL